MASLKLVKIILFSILIIGMGSCTCNRSEMQGTQDQIAEDTITIKKINPTDYFSMPSPEEILSYFNVNQLKYHPDLTCSTQEIEEYLEYENQLQMIGVYSTDLAYLTLHKRQDEILNYFYAIQNLAEKTKISSAFNKSIIDRVISNQNKPDSLAQIARESYIKVISHLLVYDLQNSLSIIFYGAFIESLYLTLDYVPSYTEKNEIIQKITEQKYAFDNLYAYSIQYITPKYNAELLVDLEKLQKVFNSFSVIKTSDETATQTKNGKLEIGGNEEITITETQFNQLKTLVVELRKNIVK